MLVPVVREPGGRLVPGAENGDNALQRRATVTNPTLHVLKATVGTWPMRTEEGAPVSDATDELKTRRAAP